MVKPDSYNLRQKVSQAIAQDSMNKSEEAPNLQYQPQHKVGSWFSLVSWEIDLLADNRANTRLKMS